MLRLTTLIMLFIMILLSCKKETNSVAEVGRFEITVEEYKDYLTKRFGIKDNYQEENQEEKQALLEQIIFRKLKLNAAYDAGLDKDPEIVNSYEQQLGQMLSNRYFEKNVIDKLFSEELVRSEFEKQKDEVRAKHVLISFDSAKRSMNKRTKEEALQLANEVAIRARDGKNFSQLALLHSDDQTKTSNGGDLGYFTWGSMVEEFQEAAFKMQVGEISDPIETMYGYHVILLEDHRPNEKFDPENFEADEENIKRRLYTIHQDTARQMWETLLDAKKSDYDFTINQNNIKKILEYNKKLKDAGELSNENINQEMKNLVLADWKGASYKFEDLLNAYGKRIARYHNNLTTEKTLNFDIERQASHKFVVQLAKEAELDKEPDIAEKSKSFLEYQLVKKIEDQEVKEKVNVTDEDVEKYYMVNKKEFTIPAKMEIWEISKSKKDKAQMVLALAKKGRDFEDLAEDFSEDNYFRKRKGYLGFKSENSRGSVSKTAFELGENKIGGPVKYRDNWVVLKTGKMEPETIKSFERSKVQARNKVKLRKTQDRREIWEKDLREKYKVIINENLLESI